MDILNVQNQLRDFALKRNWDKYHSPKNLSMALAVEASELMELFQWINSEDSLKASGDPDYRQRIAEEIADVMIYAIRIADIVQVDVEEAINSKIVKNAKKYPDDQVHEWRIE